MSQNVKNDKDRNLPLSRIRNIGIIAHIDAGKTTTTERILYYTGKSYKIGEVHEGASQMDWMDQEKERGITIVSAATTTFWTPVFETAMEKEAYRFNIIDTPGHIDFTAEVERSLRVLDGGVTVLDAEEGVQSQSETVWRQADKYKVPRICFVNKMDKLGADFFATVDDVREKLGVKPAIVNLPIGAENSFRGVVNLVNREAIVWKSDELGAKYNIIDIPAEMKDQVEEYRQKLIEQIAETDDVLLEKYLGGEELTENEIRLALRKATVAYKLVPIMAGSSLKNTGVQVLLDAIVEYLPAPTDIQKVTGINPNAEQTQEGDVESITRELTPEENFSALSFKVQTDPHVGKITYVRIYSGKLESGSYAYNATKNERERVGRLLLMHANSREEISTAYAGEIVAVVGLKSTGTGDTLCDPDHPIIYEGINFAEPVISLAIEPKTKSDQEKLGLALNKLSEEDPTFQIKINKETGQTLIAGVGELQLEVLVERLKREFKVDANVGEPQVAYRESIRKSAEGEGKYVRQSGGRGQYGHCLLRLEPKGRGEGFEFVNQIKGGAIPSEFIPAIQKGVVEAMENGILAGYPISDVQVTVYDGSFHEVDSSEIAFKIAGSLAFQEAAKRAELVLLEPVMKVEVTTPEEFMGDIIGDLSAKRAQIRGTETRGKARLINALIPLAELGKYATILRSMTQGRASYYMESSHYDEVPSNITELIIAQNKNSTNN